MNEGSGVHGLKVIFTWRVVGMGFGRQHWIDLVWEFGEARSKGGCRRRRSCYLSGSPYRDAIETAKTYSSQLKDYYRFPSLVRSRPTHSELRGQSDAGSPQNGRDPYPPSHLGKHLFLLPPRRNHGISHQRPWDRLKAKTFPADGPGMGPKSMVLPLILCAVAAAQSESTELAAIRTVAGDHYDREELVSGRPIPVPFFDLGPSLMGGGYASFAYRVDGGLNMEATHVIFRADAAYDDGRKVDDNDQPNPKGHDRYLNGGLYFRPAHTGWTRMFYLGAGYRWSQLSTTKYTKGGSRLQLGGGYDWFLR